LPTARRPERRVRLSAAPASALSAAPALSAAAPRARVNVAGSRSRWANIALDDALIDGADRLDPLVHVDRSEAGAVGGDARL
jgi:hypothetical protein